MFIIKVIVKPGMILYFKEFPFLFTSNINNAFHFVARNNALLMKDDLEKYIEGYNFTIETHNDLKEKFCYSIINGGFVGVEDYGR